MTTCTIGPSAVTGQRCNQPAVATFTASDGTVYAECADHHHPVQHFGRQVGDAVQVRRYGKTYVGQVVRVTRTGRVFAQFTYANGAQRTVEV